MIGILVPMPQEIELILHHMEVETVMESGMRKYYKGKIEGKEVVVALSRIGKVASAVTAAYMINHFPIKQMIVTGVAGGASADVKIGDICIATEAIQHDMDARGLFPQYEIPLLGIKKFTAEPVLIEKAEKAVLNYLHNGLNKAISSNILNELGLNAIKIHKGMLASGDQFIGSEQQLNAIKQGIPEVLFVEMEGAAVAQVCFEHNIPLINIRIISDNANDAAHIDFDKFIEKAAKFLAFGIITHYLQDN